MSFSGYIDYFRLLDIYDYESSLAFLITLVFMFTSSLGFLSYWVFSEKLSPFVFQTKSAHFYTVFVLFLSLLILLWSDLVISVATDFVWTAASSIDVRLKMNVDDVMFGLVSMAVTNGGLFDVFFFMGTDRLSSWIDNTFFTSCLRFFIIFVSLVSVSFISHYLFSVRSNYFEFYVFVLYSTAAMLILVSSQHAVLTYVSIELQSLALYLMAASQRKSIHSVEAGLKYLFIGSLASGCLLLGFSYFYSLTGSFFFPEIANLLINYADEYNVYQSFLSNDSLNPDNRDLVFLPNQSNFFFIIGASLLVIGALLIKLAVAPFHLWVADVYEGSPSSATIYFLLVPKLALVAVLYILVYKLLGWGNFQIGFGNVLMYNLFAFCSIATFVVGYTGVMSRGITLKRFFAFSGIAHLGFILIPLTINHYFSESMQSPFLSNPMYTLIIYMILYVLLSIPSVRLLIVCTHPLVDNLSGRRVHYSLENLPSLLHVVNGANALMLFSLFTIFVGIPPTAGFFMKLYPLVMLTGSFGFLTYLIWPIILFSSYVYVRAVIVLFFKNFREWNPRSWSSLFLGNYIISWVSVFLTIFLTTYAFQSGVIEFIGMDIVTNIAAEFYE